MSSRFFTERLFRLVHQRKQQLVLTLPQEGLLALVLQQLATLRLVYTLPQEQQTELVCLDNLQLLIQNQYQELQPDTGVFRLLSVEMK
jgi:hypothetical protein